MQRNSCVKYNARTTVKNVFTLKRYLYNFISLTGKYQAYGSLSRQPKQGNNRDQSPQSNHPQSQTPNRENRSGSVTTLQGANQSNSRGRMSLSLRRGPSSSSTSDNNSDATFTDNEFNSRRRLPSQSGMIAY